MKVEIEVRDEEVVEQVVIAVTDRMDAKFGDVLSARIEALIETRLTKLTDDRLATELDKVIAEGWRLTNSYGEPTGQKVTLSSKVLGYLTKASYNDPMDTIFRQHLDKAMNGEMGRLITEATARLRAALDQSIADKLRKAVTEALR